MFPEDIEIEKLNEQRRRILGAVSDTLAKAEEARKRLPELQKQLAETIFRAAMGQASETDVNIVRFDILYAERAVDAGELVVEPARRAESRLAGEYHKLSRKRLYRQQYEELKTKINEAGAASEKETSSLLDLCLILTGSYEEASAIMANLSPKAA